MSNTMTTQVELSSTSNVGSSHTNTTRSSTVETTAGTTTSSTIVEGGAVSQPQSVSEFDGTSSGLVQRRATSTSASSSTPENSTELSLTPAPAAGIGEVYNYDVLQWEKVDYKSYKRKPKKSIRRFYDEQNALIDRLQSFYTRVPTNEFEANNNDRLMNDDDHPPSNPKAVSIAIQGSFALNVLLLVLKIVASVLSGSMSVIASAADSLLDLLSGSVLVFTHRLMKNNDPSHYPQGKSRMEPIGVFAFAIIMLLSSLQILIEAVKRLVSQPKIDLGYFTLAILGFTILSKAYAYYYCQKISLLFKSSTCGAYSDDHRNDVLTNMVGVAAAVLSVYIPKLWFFDSSGAICIAIYIIYNWFLTGQEQLRFLNGRGASPMLLQELTYIAANHDPRIQYVDTVRAYHFGIHYLVEVDIVLPEDMPLRETHDIGETLQHRLEELEDVERAFVHNDYEWDHPPVTFRGNSIIRK